MSQEDIRFAKQHLEWGDENILEIVQEFKQIDDKTDEILFKADPHDNCLSTLICVSCGDELPSDSVNVMDVLPSKVLHIRDDENDMLKQLQKAQNEGLSIEYRCPRCRSCNDCRRSFETERVSLREEAEDLMIWDSVKIDWENKQIICHLPMRGKESDFLSPNRDIALKVLNQQCQKYSKDADTRASVSKAFKKLLDNGQLVLWKDLTEQESKHIFKRG